MYLPTMRQGHDVENRLVIEFDVRRTAIDELQEQIQRGVGKLAADRDRLLLSFGKTKTCTNYYYYIIIQEINYSNRFST